jgi:alcohol dehydrogenase (cytochrome c)
VIRSLFFLISTLFGVIAPAAFAQIKDYPPVTPEMLLNPGPDDWLMPSRTYDWHRFSPLNQINKQNVGQLTLAWARGMGPGGHEGIPLAYHGVLYVANPDDVIQALDATNGELIWENRRKLPDDWKKFTEHKSRAMALYDDMLFYTSADGFVVALDAATGAMRWQTQTQDYHTKTRHTSGPIIVDGKVITGRSCANDPFFYPEVSRNECFIAAHDAKTGKELWRFYTAAGPNEPGGETWGSTPAEKRTASPWGLPGSYDPVRKLIFWGIGNTSPYPRLERHLGNVDDVPRSSPADLYSDSTVALNTDTGKLAWYFQQVPGDDWDLDAVHERILIRTPLNPDPNSVKWINPRITRGQERDVVVDSPEEGGIWVVDRSNGQFLWATPFPYDAPEFAVARVDVETGKTFMNWDLVFKKDGERHTICYEDQKGWYPMSYHPGKNSLYIPYNDFCADMQIKLGARQGWGIRNAVPRPGSDPKALGGIAKVNMATGQIQRFYSAPVGGHGATLATAGDLIFWGDANRRLRAFDADSGKILWETILASAVESSTITYAVKGKQYIAVLTGEGSGIRKYLPDAKPAPGHNTVYVFSLPEKR